MDKVGDCGEAQRVEGVDTLINSRITHVLIHPTLARRDHSTLSPQPRQGNPSFALVATADTVRNDVDFVSVLKEV